jgi:hypothetical protein
MNAITKVLAAGMITATLATGVAAAIASASIPEPDKNVHLELTNNIREAVGILDVQVAVVIDKNNYIHVLTVTDIENPDEDEPDIPQDDDPAGGGQFSTQIKQEGRCWWLTRNERNQDGALIRADKVCIGGRGCPIGQRQPVA